MSTIADALKKAETSSETPNSPPPSPTPLWIYRAALVGCVVVVLLGIAQFTQRSAPVAAAPTGVIPNPSPPAAAAPPKTSVQRFLQLAQGNLVLSGIIQGRDGRSLALINNQVVQEGDQIQGIRVVQVNPKSVEIQDGAGRTRMLQLKD